MLRTQAGALRPLWRAAHELLMRGVAWYLCRGVEGAAGYAAGSSGRGEPLYGISDIDLVVVVPRVMGRPGEASARVRRRWARLRRALPPLGELVDVAIYEREDLPRAIGATAFTFGLDQSRRDSAAYLGPGRLANPALVEGPGLLYGLTAAWRPLRPGPPLPPAREPDARQRRLAAWLNLQSWWRFWFSACLRPDAPRTPYLAVKLVSEPARIWLWLVHGERFFGRRATLERALVLLPDEGPAIRAALDLHRRLPGRAVPDLPEMLSAFVRLSDRIAALLIAESYAHGQTEVRLIGAGDSPEGLVPLADWRALVWSFSPDEQLLPWPGDPADPVILAEAALAGRQGPYPALRAHELLVLPSADEGGMRSRLRAVQCAASDPVSWALLDGRDVARFPDVAGWSARDWARRAVAEHAAWLRTDPAASVRPPLARALSAVRAALFLESVESGEPELAVTLDAAIDQLGARLSGGDRVADELRVAYRDWRERGSRPDSDTVATLYDLVGRLLGVPTGAGAPS